MADVTTAVHSHLKSEYTDLLTTVSRCADSVAAAWVGESTTERTAVVGPLEAALRQSGVWSELPTMLADAVQVAGYRMQARPVPGAPYVVMMSTGPLLRATLSEGRLLVRLRVFDVDHDGETVYTRTNGTPAEVVDVEFR